MPDFAKGVRTPRTTATRGVYCQVMGAVYNTVQTYNRAHMQANPLREGLEQDPRHQAIEPRQDDELDAGVAQRPDEGGVERLALRERAVVDDARRYPGGRRPLEGPDAKIEGV